MILLIIGSSVLGQDDPFADVELTKPAGGVDDTFKVFLDPNGKEYFSKEEASYYTRYLAAMSETSLKAPLAVDVRKTFRLTYLRSFHDPLVIRLTMKDGTSELRAVRLKRDREYRPVEITHDELKRLDQKKSDDLLQLIEKEDLWENFTENEIALMESGMDGSAWIFEKHDENGYKMIDVWSPQYIAEIVKDEGFETEKDFLIYFQVGVRLLEEGGILPEKDERY